MVEPEQESYINMSDATVVSLKKPPVSAPLPDQDNYTNMADALVTLQGTKDDQECYTNMEEAGVLPRSDEQMNGFDEVYGNFEIVSAFHGKKMVVAVNTDPNPINRLANPGTPALVPVAEDEVLFLFFIFYFLQFFLT